MTNNKQQTAVEWLLNEIWEHIEWKPQLEKRAIVMKFEQAKEMDKEQSIGLIKQTAMFMAASHLDEEIANMSYEDVYKTYYEQTYGGGQSC